MESVPTPDHAAGGRNGALVKPFALRAIAGSRLRLDSIDHHAARDERLSVILCERGTVLTTSPGIVALACPILGGASVMTGEWNAHLRKADIVVGDAQTRHDIVVSPRGACIVVAGTRAAWAALDRNGGTAVRSATVLFPAVHRTRQALCRRLLRLARHCLGDTRAPGGKHLAQQLACFVDDLQAGFAVMIARCPGSSLPRKKAVFLRLQRVRNFISACAHEDLDVARLALMANYSVGHFITTFRCVFEETPYSNVSRYRLESASSLLSGSKRGIADIAQAIGFQSRSSFTRAIKKHLGSSATQFRASLGAFEPPPPAHGDTAERSISGNRRDSGPSELPNGQEQE
ncbi:MAG TPA: AraC family transcriptional regulator [Rudaea sp.]|nr:AraC family transcriptional regulator [Rudaea sp.]